MKSFQDNKVYFTEDSKLRTVGPLDMALISRLVEFEVDLVDKEMVEINGMVYIVHKNENEAFPYKYEAV